MTRRFGKRTAVGLVAILLAIALLYDSTFNLPSERSETSTSETSLKIGTSTTYTSSTSSKSTETLGTLYPYGVNGGIIDQDSLYPCNCSVYVHPILFPTLQDMVENSADVWLANVTSVSVVAVKGAPFTVYSIEAIKDLENCTCGVSAPGEVVDAAWFGGTANGTTMTPVGYPTLSVGQTYIFFLTADGTGIDVPNLDPDYWQYLPSTPDFPITLVTIGGAQGIFNIRDGNVYSLDNTDSQAYSWLPVKVDGLPLSTFESEIQNAFDLIGLNNTVGPAGGGGAMNPIHSEHLQF